MLLDLRGSTLVSQHLLGLLHEQAPDQISCRETHSRVLWEAQLLANDIEQRSPVAGSLERRLPEQQLIHENPKGPPVNSATVPLAFDDLRGQVLVRPDKRHRPCIAGLRYELRPRADRGGNFWFWFPIGLGLGLGLGGEQAWAEAGGWGCTRRLSDAGRLNTGWLNTVALAALPERFCSSASGFEDLISVGLTAQRRERSKSESMMCPSSRTRTFSGLRSRYMIPSVCKYSSARRTSAM
jgi:hypothetical protein